MVSVGYYRLKQKTAILNCNNISLSFHNKYFVKIFRTCIKWCNYANTRKIAHIFLPIKKSEVINHVCVITSSLRKRNREERIASTAQKVQQMKLKLTDSEKKKENWLFWKPILLNVGAGAAVALGLCMCWAFLSQ